MFERFQNKKEKIITIIIVLFVYYFAFILFHSKQANGRYLTPYIALMSIFILTAMHRRHQLIGDLGF